MKSIPLLFNPDMSAAVRRSINPKTQTRRKSFKGAVGDTIWGRETYYAWGEWLKSQSNKTATAWTFKDLSANGGPGYLYRSDEPDYCPTRTEGYTTYYCRPSIFMPKAASRISLQIIGVSQEKLQAIDESDAIAEGIQPVEGQWLNYLGGPAFDSPIDSFRSLWNSINADRGLGWDTNPDVFVVEFERI
jgi:hypothetical protein